MTVKLIIINIIILIIIIKWQTDVCHTVPKFRSSNKIYFLDLL